MTQVVKYNHQERFAVTADENGVEFWRPATAGDVKTRVFENSKGKSVLASDNGYGWRSAKKAANCEYFQVWFGEYPYGSYCWAIRRSRTGEVSIETIMTEVNPRGLTESERWRQECESYAPECASV